VGCEDRKSLDPGIPPTLPYLRMAAQASSCCHNVEVADFRVLTVCTGNMCRSPAAAVILRQGLIQEGLADRIEVGSAGTSWDSEGMPMDDRTVKALVSAGFEEPFDHTARTVHQSELVEWDLVLAMTAEHAATMRRKVDEIPEGQPRPDVLLWRQFDPVVPANAREEDMAVPDPWYEGQKAFDRTVLGMIRAMPSLVLYLRVQLDALDSAKKRASRSDSAAPRRSA
jgi:protein-tyrosine phosphatase